jgi:hypothetical protein
VLNVNEFFRSMFTSYQPYLAMTGAWIEARGADWAAFSREHDMRILGENAETIQARISRRNEQAASYAVFQFSKTNYSIRQVQFYNADQLVYSVANAYTTIGNYYLPMSMTITAYREGKSASVSSLGFFFFFINPVLKDDLLSSLV